MITLRDQINDTNSLCISAMLKDKRLVRTQRLLPGMENADLSIKEHIHKLFHSSIVPSFKYSLCLAVATAIKMNSPIPIPLQLEIVPLSEGTSDILHKTPQNIHVTGIRMILRPSTRCIASGILSHHSNGYQTKHELGLQEAFSNLESLLIINTGKALEEISPYILGIPETAFCAEVSV